jgi:putative two-component system response regulator
MALADVFDALLSERPYKKPMALPQVVSIMSEGRGRHFDPDIVDVFLENLDGFVEISKCFNADGTTSDWQLNFT